MSWSEDDWGKPFFPTRFGSPQGHATERKMLDAVGGFDGIRAKIRTNPDGSTTILKTRGGMPVFTTIPAPSNQPIYTPREGVSVFFCTPSSTMYQSGYTPSGAPGPVSRWFDWHTSVTQPNPHGGQTPVLSAFAAYEAGVGGAAESSPGSITWYGNVKLADNVPVVLSWHGGGIRSGRYDRVTWSGSGAMGLTRDMIYNWNYLPSCTQGFHLKSDIPSDSTPPSMTVSPWLWIGGVAKVKLTSGGSPLSIFSAAVRASGAGYELVVISDNHVYTGGIDLIVQTSKGATINRALDGATLEMSMGSEIPAAIHNSLMQWPYMNASATKAVYLTDTYTNAYGPRNTIYEVSLTTGVATAVSTAENSVEQVTPAMGVVLPFTDGYYNYSAYPYSVDELSIKTQGATETEYMQVYTRTIIAADYDGDTLIYLTSLNHRSLGRIETFCDFYKEGHFVSTGGSGSYSMTSWQKSYPAQETVALIHSRDGQVFFDNAAGSGYSISTVSVSGSVSGHRYDWRATEIQTSDADLTSGYASLRLYNADLRKGAYLLSILSEFNHRKASGGATGVLNVAATTVDVSAESYTGTDTYRKILRVYCSIGGVVVYDNTVSVAPDETTTVANNPSVPYTKGEHPGFTTGRSEATAESKTTYAVETPFAYTFWDSPGTEGEQCPKIAHLAISNDGSAAYFGFTGHSGLAGSFPRKEAFILGSSVMDIPANTHAPGSDDTLASPVFFPKVVEE